MLKSILPAVLLVFSAAAASAQDIVTLTRANPSVSLEPTDLVTVIGTSEARRYPSSGFLRYKLAGQTAETNYVLGGLVSSQPMGYESVLSGLSTIRLAEGSSGDSPISEGLFATLRIVKQGQQLLSTPLVTPGSADAKYDVTLETSTDMVTWVPTVPGEFLGATGQRFFRVRAVVK